MSSSVPRTPIMAPQHARQRRRHTVAIALLMLLVFVSAVPAPLGIGPAAAQVSDPACRSPDQEPRPADRRFNDYNITAFDVVMTVDGNTSRGEADKDEDRQIFQRGGSLTVTVDVANEGTNTSKTGRGDLEVRVTLSGNTAATRTAIIKEPVAGASDTAQVLFSGPIPSGTTVMSIVVNPPASDGTRKVAEVCQDEGFNSACPQNGATGCRYTYYGNNARTFKMLVGPWPDLKISDIHVEAPVRASEKASADTKATFEVTITNAGATLAYAHSADKPGGDDYELLVELPGATCEGDKDDTSIAYEQLAAGESVTTTITCEMVALAGLQTVNFTIDATEVVIESNEKNNKEQRTFNIPAPDIVVDIATAVNFVNGTYFLPEGRDFDFDVILDNIGQARAADSKGGNFVMTIDFEGETVSETEHVLEPLESVIVPIHIEAENLTAKSRAYFVSVFPDADDDVLEADEENLVTFEVLVAHFEAAIESSNPNATTAMGTFGQVPIKVTNAGTVKDTIDLLDPTTADVAVNGTGNATAIDVSGADFVYLDANDKPITRLDLAPGASRDLFAAFRIPSTAAVGDTYTTTAIARSRTLDDEGVIVNLTFTTTPDDVAPTVTLHDPPSGVIRGDTVTIRVTDNVAVEKVEYDLPGSFTTLEATDTSQGLYTFSIAGTVGSFSFNVKATDVNGNTATTKLDLLRDNEAPQFTSHRFSSGDLQKALPGSTLRLGVTVLDDNLQSVDVRIIQPGNYDRNFTLQPGANNEVFLQWKVPARPGRYFFDVTARDLAGNTARYVPEADPSRPYPGRVVYYVPGLNIEMVGLPSANPRIPTEVGQRVTISYTLINTSPQYETGLFEARFALDAKRFIGRETLNLPPGQSRTIAFPWVVESGPHDFTLVIDQTDTVPEDNEEDNLVQANTGTLFPRATMFERDLSGTLGASLTDRVASYWFVPVLLAVNVALFAVATVLRRQASQ